MTDRLSAEALAKKLNHIVDEGEWTYQTEIIGDAADCIEDLTRQLAAANVRADAAELWSRLRAEDIMTLGLAAAESEAQLAVASARADAAEALVRSMQEGTAVVLDGFQARYDAAVQALEAERERCVHEAESLAVEFDDPRQAVAMHYLVARIRALPPPIPPAAGDAG